MERPMPPVLAGAPPLDDEQIAGTLDRGDRWVPINMGQAEWAMRHVVLLRQQIEAIQAQAGEWHDEINRWVAHEQAEPLRRLTLFADALDAFAREYRADTGKATLSLPSGEVRTRGPRPGAEVKVKVADKDAFVEWWQTEKQAGLLDPAWERAVVAVTVWETNAAVVKEAAAVVEAEDGTLRVIDPATGQPVPGLVAERKQVTVTVAPEGRAL